MNRIRRFWGRSSIEKKVFYESLMLVPVVRLGLATRGFQHVRKWLLRRDSRAQVLAGATPEIVDWAVQSVAKRALHDRPCLTQSLVVSHMLRRAGYRPEVRIGVAKSGARLEAHAWVELDGTVVSGGRRSPEIFTPLTSIDRFEL